MKILLVHNYYRYFGGEDGYFTSLSDLLKRKKHEVMTYTKESKHIRDDFFSWLNVTKGMFWNTQVFNELLYIIKKNKPEIAHFNNIYPLITPTAYWICRKFNIPIVQTVHNYRFLCPKGILFRDNQVCNVCINKNFSYLSIIYGCYHTSHLASFVYSFSYYFHRLIKLFNSIDIFIFPTEFPRKYYINNLGIVKNATKVIPYFIDAGDGENYDKRERDDYFLFVGRLSEEKGILPLLDLFKSLPQLRLIVIGDGPLRDRLEEYKKYKNIILKGFLGKKEVFKHMQDSLAVIIPSLWYEVLPMVLIESFTCGTPVIVPKIGSFRSLIQDGNQGLFFEFNNFEDLRDKIIKLSRNKDMLNQMGRNARNEYKKKYTPEIHYQVLMKVYKSLA